MPDKKDVDIFVSSPETKGTGVEVEKPASREGTAEIRQRLEQKPEVQAVEVAEAPSTAPLAQVKALPVPKDPELKRIEDVLAEDLTEIFLALPEDKRMPFKQKGEEIAREIKTLVEKGKATARKIRDLIREWLSMIPGVNKYFLEQDTKIKTDHLMAIIEQK